MRKTAVFLLALVLLAALPLTAFAEEPEVPDPAP